MENGPALGPEREDCDCEGHCKAVVCILVVLILIMVIPVALLGMQLAAESKRTANDVMKEAVEAGVAEFVEHEVEYARGRTGKRIEFRWKKCKGSAQIGVK